MAKTKTKGKAKTKKSAEPGANPGRVIPPHVREAASEALKGNDFWNLRAKHGRDKLFATPELMWEAACEYFEEVTNNPEHESKPFVVPVGNNCGSTVEMIKVPIKRPFTLHGLCLYLRCGLSYFRNFKANLKDDNKSDKDFRAVIEQIEETIYNQKFSGAASGFFNANIIARDLGIADKTEGKFEGQVEHKVTGMIVQ
jgi:hypothetical protein